MDWLARLDAFKGKLKDIGYEKERGALSLLALSFMTMVYFVVGFNTPPEWTRVFWALSLLYLVGFLGIASQWFWARWFAKGLGGSGFMVGVMALVMIGWHPSLGIYTLVHAIVMVMLTGTKMVERYEMQPAWRERYKMDEFGVARLGKAVTRGSASLPTLVMWALAPREGDQMLWLPFMALGLGVLGLHAILRNRSWGLLALGAGAGAALSSFLLMAPLDPWAAGVSFGAFWSTLGSPPLAVGFLTFGLLPFAGAIAAFLRSPSR